MQNARQRYLKILWPMALIIVCTIIHEVLRHYKLEYTITPNVTIWGVVGTFRLIGFAWLINSIIDILVFERTLRNKRDAKFVKALKILVTSLVYGAFLLIILGSELKTPLVAVTGFLGAGLIFGLRDLIERISYGTVLNIGAEFSNGDVITIKDDKFKKTVRISEINLNYVYCEDNSGELFLIPNSSFKSLITCNHSTSTRNIKFFIEIMVDHQYISLAEARSLFEASMLSIDQILREPRPVVVINAITRAGSIKYQLVFWTDISLTASFLSLQSQIYNNIIDYANISRIDLRALKLNVEQVNVQIDSSRLELKENIIQSLKLTKLFSDLQSGDIMKLVDNIKVHVFYKNDYIIKQSEVGSSMYILVHGLLQGTIKDIAHDNDIAKFVIKPGQFFGEMSLFLGEPRSAFVTVTTQNALIYEIEKDALFTVFESNPELLEKVATKVAERRMNNAKLQQDYIEHSASNYSSQNTLKRIKQWLGFKLSN